MIALPLPVLTDIENGRMLHPRGDDAALFGLRLQGAPDGGIVAFGTAGREQDFLGLRAEQRGHLFPRILHGAADLPAEGVHAGGIAVQIRQIGQHGIAHFGRNSRRGVIVEINGFHD